jgi:hypothetical protein
MGATDIAELFGVSKAAVSHMETRDKSFPKPLKRINKSKQGVWNADDIEAYGRLTGRLPLKAGHIYDERGYDLEGMPKSA